MPVDERFYVRNTTIAYFYVVLIKKLVQLVMWWVMFANQSQKRFTYFCHYRLSEQWVKPDDIRFSLSVLGVIDTCFLKFQFMVITRFIKGFLVYRN